MKRVCISSIDNSTTNVQFQTVNKSSKGSKQSPSSDTFVGFSYQYHIVRIRPKRKEQKTTAIYEDYLKALSTMY